MKSLKIARKGVAMLARTMFLERVRRYEAIYRDMPPTKFAQFIERVPMVKGRLDKKASTATAYAWFVWEKESGASHHDEVAGQRCSNDSCRGKDA